MHTAHTQRDKGHGPDKEPWPGQSNSPLSYK
jgi:hypothetical protein